MVSRRIVFAPGSFYHVYNRGVDKRTIFMDDVDYRRFQELLFLANSTQEINVRNIKREYPDVFSYQRGEPLVAIGAYCLMPNHFHLLLTPVVDDGITRFLNKLATCFVMYFNHRYERSGALFEGRFKAQYVDSDTYLKYLFSYILLNPIKLHQSDWKEQGIKNQVAALDFLHQYRYSAYDDILSLSRGLSSGKRPEAKVLDLDPFPNYFGDDQDLEQELIEWLSFPEERPREN